MTDTDIRAWARDNGVQLGRSGPIPRAVRSQYQDANPVSEPVEFDGETGATVTLDTAEVKPEVKPQGLKGKLVFKRPAREPRESKAPKRRAATSTFLGGGWSGLAALVGRSGFEPVGICMAFQAPVAGELLEQATKGTVVDKLVQPLARTTERSKALGALVGPPLIVAAIQQRPQLYKQLAPVLEECLYTWVELAGPMVEKKIKQRQQREEQFGTDVKAMMDAIFMPMVLAAQAAQEAAQSEPTEPEGRPTAKPKRGAGGRFQKAEA